MRDRLAEVLDVTKRCPTCGEDLGADIQRCPSCGEGVGRSVQRPVRVRRCPRCDYRGEGIPYFRRPAHMGILVLLTLVTYGLGGLLYWLVRRNRRVCPSCGLRWEYATEGRRVPSDGEGQEGGLEPDRMDLPSGGGARRFLGVVGVLVAALLVSLGLFGGDVTLASLGAVTGAGGAGLFWWGWNGLQERREALLEELQRKVLLLADRKGGVLTVTEAAAELDLSLEAAEKVLISMDDGFRVRSEITREGLLYYEFPEIRHRSRLDEPETLGSGGGEGDES